MPVLILGTASVLLFFFVVALLSIANTLESQTLQRKRILMLSKPLALLSITDAFDPIYSVLWEAPITALGLIDAAGASGLPGARLRPLYDEAAARFPEIYDGYSFLQWLQFLEEADLISRQGHTLVLTRDGQSFLKFRFVTNAMVEA